MRLLTMTLIAITLFVTSCSAQVSDTADSGTTSVETTVASMTTEPPAATTSTTATQAATTNLEVTTTSADTTTTTAVTYDVVLEGGTDEVPEISVQGPDVFEQKVGDEVAITVLSSVEDEIHVHGYDVRFDAAPSEVTVVTFTADVLGIFEVELEERHIELFLIEVTP